MADKSRKATEKQYYQHEEGAGSSRRVFLKSALASSIAVGSIPAIAGQTEAQQTNSEDWPMFHFDVRNTGYNPATVGPKDEIEERWRFETDEASSSGYDFVWSSPAIVGNTVYVGSRDGNREGGLYALDRTTGAKIWKHETGAILYSSPVVVNNTAIIGDSSQGKVYAVDTNTGKSLWTFEAAGKIRSSPTVANDTVFFGCGTKIYALSITDGTKLWDFSTGNQVRSTPAVHEQVLYIRSMDGNVYAVTASTGEEIWRSTVDDEVRQSSPCIAGGTVFIGTLDRSDSSGYMYALDASDGQKEWIFETDYFIYSSPAAANGTIYFGSLDNHVYAVDAKIGEEVWRFETDRNVYSSAAVVDGVVYIGDDSGKMYALDAADGTELWNYSVPGRVKSSPAVVNDQVYFGTGEGYVFNITSVLEVEIDIKPGSETNPIRIGEEGRIPVGILQTTDFNPITQVDVSTLRFGAPDVVDNGGGAKLVHEGGHRDDVNNDGDDDLLLHFPIKDTGFDRDDEVGKLVGETNDRTTLSGTNTINLVGNEVT